jgi:alpha-ketoglutarate-dependent taurine dioxygenase
MKITKIPGLGRFGIFIDDVDFATITDEEWLHIGQLHLESLVTILRNVTIAPAEYERRMAQWGRPRHLADYQLGMKYLNGGEIDAMDQAVANQAKHIMASEIGPDTMVARVAGGRDQDGNPLGMFAEGELLWHSNESGNLCFSPFVSLLGVKNVVGSATGFVTTADWYEAQSSAFQSELDEMIIQHEFTPGKINPGLNMEQDLVMYRNMCPEPSEIPLVIQSPGGIKGLHYSINTINSIKGMTHADSQKMFDHINKTLFVEQYIYDHWWPQDNDLLLFDNSITLHRRLGDIKNRLCYRIQFDIENLDVCEDRYFKEPFAAAYRQEINKLKEFYQT